jgi:uncharacterized protein YecE (DUF72 family)
MPGKAYIGTSGWNYKSWREHFYGDTPQKRWLRFCAERFTSIEVNGTFYRLQPQSTFEKWRNETPDEFPFALKGHRYVTHNKKLIDVEEPVIRCRDAASPLGKRLAAVVWQLPAFFKKNIERLEIFLRTLRHWETTRHAIEFRHKTWFDDEVAECLTKYAVAVLYVRRAGLAAVGPGDDGCGLHPSARAHSEIRVQLQQALAQELGQSYLHLVNRKPRRPRLFR